LFDKHKNDSAATTAFPFDEEFGKLYPDKATDVAAHNCRVAGIQMAAGKTPFEANQAALKEIAAKNAAPAAAAPIELQSELIGYQYDAAFGLLLKRLVPVGLFGFMVAAILGAVTSTLAAMLNAASTIFTMDIYRHYLNKTASQSALVLVGRISVVVCMVIGCFIAPLLGHPKFRGIFTFIQEFQGFISPGILAVFLYGLFVKRAPRACGVMGLLLSPVAYGLLMVLAPQVAFLDRMAIAFFAVVIALGIMSVVRPLREPITMPAEAKIELAASRGAKLAGIGVVLVTVALYVIFW
jgi:SSS family solute:Na+ symporter